MYKWLTFFLLIGSASLSAATTNVTLTTSTGQTDFYGYVGVSNSITAVDQQVLLEKNAGNSTDSPHKLYVPIKGTGSTIGNTDYTILSVSKIPSRDSGLGYIRVDLTVSTDQTDYYLEAMVDSTGGGTSSSTTWTSVETSVYNSNNDLVTSVSSANYKVILEINDICTFASICKDESYNDNRKIYFFLSSSSISNESKGLKPETYPGGVYIDFNASDEIPDATPTDVGIKKGDSEVTLSYTGSYSNSFFRGVLGCYRGDSTCDNLASGLAYQNQSPTCTLYSTIFGANSSGDVTIKGLVNNLEYSASLAYVNKFYFASTFTAAVACVTPLEIEAPLNENQCYLLTAGFGGHHYVINYFRYIRDTYLANSFLGRKFIEIYYETAPQYTNYIINTPWLSALIRAGAYTLYFIFHHMVLVLSAMLGGILLIIMRQKKLFRR